MHSRTLRSAVVFGAASALAIATIAPSGAAEDPAVSGVGMASGASSLLTFALGDGSLALRLLGEDATTSNEPNTGPLAVERVSPLTIDSTLVAALGALTQPTVETRTTGGEDVKSTSPVDLSALLASGPVPGLVSGTIGAVTVRSAVDAVGAVSSATGSVTDLAILGGLLRAGTASVGLGSTALVTDSGAERLLQLDNLEVLDLTALLGSLGISLGDLPIDTAINLLDQLGLPLPGGLSADALLTVVDGLLADTAGVRGQVEGLQDQIGGLTSQVTSLTSQASAANTLVASLTSQLSAQQGLLGACVILCGPLQTLVTSLTSQLSAATVSAGSITSTLTTVQAQIATLVGQVQTLLDTVAGALDDLLGTLDAVTGGLDGASLIVVDDVVAGVTARADESLSSSIAAVSGSIGSVQVGGTSLGGLDLGATAGQVTALSDQVTSVLGGLLTTIDPALGNVVDIDLLDKTTALDEADGITSASAAITALRATITPPDVCGVLSRLAAAPDTLGGLLTSVGVGSLPVGGPVADLLGTVGSTVSCNLVTGVSASSLVDGLATALTQPLQVEALSVSGQGTYTTSQASTTGNAVPGIPGTPGTLPSTGGSLPFALLALFVGAIGMGTRWLLVRAS
ncbi:MAG: hypothetical protein WD691_03380 [Acidimicrobiales bacterium]